MAESCFALPGTSQYFFSEADTPVYLGFIKMVSWPPTPGKSIANSDGTWQPLDISVSIRTQRDQLISETDWLTLQSRDTGRTISPEWLAYRQALRDITKQSTFPYSVSFPAKPIVPYFVE